MCLEEELKAVSARKPPPWLLVAGSGVKILTFFYTICLSLSLVAGGGGAGVELHVAGSW